MGKVLIARCSPRHVVSHRPVSRVFASFASGSGHRGETVICGRNGGGRQRSAPSSQKNCGSHTRRSIRTAGIGRTHRGAEGAEMALQQAVSTHASRSFTGRVAVWKSSVFFPVPIPLDPRCLKLLVEPRWGGYGQAISGGPNGCSHNLQAIERAHLSEHRRRVPPSPGRVHSKSTSKHSRSPSSRRSRHSTRTR
jgi:hypothetical protein